MKNNDYTSDQSFLTFTACLSARNVTSPKNALLSALIVDTTVNTAYTAI